MNYPINAILPICLIIVFSALNGYGQYCGTIPNLELNHPVPPPVDQIATSRSSKIHIPLLFHFISKKETPVIDIPKINENIAILNKEFLQTNIEFHLCGTPKYIQDPTGFLDYASAKDLGSEFINPQKVNIFVVDKLDIGTGYNPNYTGFGIFPTSENEKERFVFLAKGSFNRGVIFGHELGHLFGLWHTHETRYGKELVDGSNCQTAGDHICDTPADPNLQDKTYRCIYNDESKDENGNIYQPDVSNIMSYADLACTDKFTEGQIRVMRYYLQHFFNLKFDCPKLVDKTLLFPNPVGSRFNISLNNSKIATDIILSIENTLGQQIKKIKGYKQGITYFSTLDASNLTTGIYYLKVYYLDSKEVEKFKFIKI